MTVFFFSCRSYHGVPRILSPEEDIATQRLVTHWRALASTAAATTSAAADAAISASAAAAAAGSQSRRMHERKGSGVEEEEEETLVGGGATGPQPQGQEGSGAPGIADTPSRGSHHVTDTAASREREKEQENLERGTLLGSAPRSPSRALTAAAAPDLHASLPASAARSDAAAVQVLGSVSRALPTATTAALGASSSCPPPSPSSASGPGAGAHLAKVVQYLESHRLNINIRQVFADLP